MPSDARLHRSFLLRLWRAGNGNAPQWRMSLEDTQTHERQGFVDLAGLVVFLEEQIRSTMQSHLHPNEDHLSSEENRH